MRALAVQRLGDQLIVLRAPDADEMRPARVRDPEIIGEYGRLQIRILPLAPHQSIQGWFYELLKSHKGRDGIAW